MFGRQQQLVAVAELNPGTMPVPAGASPSPQKKPQKKSQGKFVVPKRRKKRNPNQTPGPGAYELDAASRTRNVRAPGWGFGTANMGSRPIATFGATSLPVWAECRCFFSCCRRRRRHRCCCYCCSA
jgi:hypothetical protein